MPICSYLVYPANDRFDSVISHLNLIPGCEAVPDDNRQIIILVTETSTEDENKHLHDKLAGMDTIDCIAMTFGEFSTST